MRNVKGFLSDDGVFFDVKEDAELYEALHALEASVRNIGADPEKFMIVVGGCSKQLRRYLDAKSAYEKAENAQFEPSRKRGEAAQHSVEGEESSEGDNAEAGRPDAAPADDHADNAVAKVHAPVLEQPADEPEYVPDVRSGIGTESVPDDGTLNGARGRGAHARNLRRAANMATTSHAALTASRTGDSPAPVREAEARAKLLQSGV